MLLTRNLTDIDNDVIAAAGFPNNPRVCDVDFVANRSSSSASACDVIIVIETASLRLLTSFSLRAPANVSARRGCDVAAPLASSRVDQYVLISSTSVKYTVTVFSVCSYAYGNCTCSCTCTLLYRHLSPFEHRIRPILGPIRKSNNFSVFAVNVTHKFSTYFGIFRS